MQTSANLNNQAAGSYFVQVVLYSNIDANYTLRLSNSDPNNLLAAQEDFGTLATGGSGLTRSDFIENGDTSDMYLFNLKNTTLFNASISGLSADADLRLIFDRNVDGIAQDTEVMASSTNGGISNDGILKVLDPGYYFLQVHQYGGFGGNGDTNYNLAVSTMPPIE